MNYMPINVVVGSVVRDGKCLLIRRIKDPYKGYWSIPGGKVEYGEHAPAAIVREIKEETGLDVKFSGIRGIVSETLHDHENNATVGHFFIWVCGLEHVTGNPAEQKEGKLAWFDEAELERQKEIIIPSDYLMLKRFVFADAPLANFHTVRMRSLGSEYHIEHTDL